MPLDPGPAPDECEVGFRGGIDGETDGGTGGGTDGEFDVGYRVAALNRRYRHHGATAVLERALGDPQVGRIALVSSFGAESVVLLHMVSVMDRSLPVLFIDTAMLFAETLAYQVDLSDRLGLTDVRILRPDAARIAALDPYGALHLRDPDACCDLRKTQVLQDALAPYSAWITGRKRFQGGQRTALEFFENEADMRIKVNPLAHWTRDDVRDYMVNNRLPGHPLVAQGYRSIGCRPCTSKVGANEDDRAGRWRGRGKIECGIHFGAGRSTPPAARAASAASGSTEAGQSPEGDMSMNVMMNGPENAVPVKDVPVKDVTGNSGGAATVPANTAPANTEPTDPVPANTVPTDSVIVTDSGFAADDWTGPLAPPAPDNAEAVLLAPDADPEILRGRLADLDLIVVDFPSFSDGRGFTIARRLRLMGYAGRLRARGHVIADQYTMARRVGFDEVEISADLAARQPEDQWRRRAAWGAHDYQSRLRA